MWQMRFLNNYNLVIKSIVVLVKHCDKINYLYSTYKKKRSSYQIYLDL